MSVPTTKTALLTPLSLPGGLQIIECKTAPSSSNITRNPSADSGFDVSFKLDRSFFKTQF